MRTSIKSVSVALVAVALLSAACSDSKDDSGSGATGDKTSTTTATANDPALNQWAIEYTGGKAAKATGTPFKIGYVNQDAFFPEATIGVNAAVAYANAELNGAGGRPIEIVKCQVDHGRGWRQVRCPDGERQRRSRWCSPARCSTATPSSTTH